MMLRHSCALEQEAVAIESAVQQVLADGARTPDLAGKDGRRGQSYAEHGIWYEAFDFVAALAAEHPDSEGISAQKQALLAPLK